jgi:hypothetical protein
MQGDIIRSDLEHAVVDTPLTKLLLLRRKLDRRLGGTPITSRAAHREADAG